MVVRRKKTSGGVSETIRLRHGWLDLLQTSGPFLTIPVVHRVFPDGLPPVSTAHRAQVRAQVESMLTTNGNGRSAVADALLSGVADWAHRRSDHIPDAVSAIVPEHGQIVRPDFAFVVEDQDDSVDDPADSDSAEDYHQAEADDESEDDSDDDNDADDDNAEADDSAAGAIGPYRLFGMYVPWGTHPLTRTTSGGWTASAAERMAVLLRARSVPIGLVTDGRWWALVWAPLDGATGIAVWDAGLFSEEPDTLAAFAAFLGRSRFLGVQSSDTLPELLAESSERQEEVTETLGRQVRDAVELLLDTVDRMDHDSSGQLLRDVDDDDLYAGVVTVMMRIVFLLFAEERRLLPSDDEIYSSAYSVGSLVENLESRAAVAGEQSLEHRTGAWHRLLAVARAVHSGVHHENLRLPAYGSGLFNPEVHPWLEGRGKSPNASARPPAIDDRTVLRMLRAVQFVTIGGHRRRLTFRALSVEQIGYVYEGLLELEVRTADEVTLHLERPAKWPKAKLPSEVTIDQVREWVEAVPPQLAAQVKARTLWTASKVEAKLRDMLDDHLHREALASVQMHDPTAASELLRTVRSISPVLRRDQFSRPVITLPGRRYVAQSTRRASTGTHYTPPQLADEVAAGALAPLVYRPGPLETADVSAWVPRPSSEILELRVADIAMGSGAFLVAACKYLADRLMEARQIEGDREAIAHQKMADGRSYSGDVEVPAILLKARRTVAEKCLYGVDINPLAVEMAKLSMWLFTMDRERPFGFLDDRFLCGDSLLGILTVEQLEYLHIDPVMARKAASSGTTSALDFSGEWRRELLEAADYRRRITSRSVEQIRDVEFKHGLLAKAQDATNQVSAVADYLTGVGIQSASLPVKKLAAAFVMAEFAVGDTLDDGDFDSLRRSAQEMLQAGKPNRIADREPLHWPISFPELFADSRDPGFDAVIGNPPFLGGTYISGLIGDDYSKWLQKWDGKGITGNADLAARFVLRAQHLLSSRGQLGFIATNGLVEGATLKVGLEQVLRGGMTVTGGRSSHKWPSAANLEIVNLWLSKARVAVGGQKMLDFEPVVAIGPDLQPVGRVSGPKYQLRENEDLVFNGSKVYGQGFVLTHEQAKVLAEMRDINEEVLFPYVIGKDLNQRPDSSASRAVINFGSRDIAEAERYAEPFEIVERLVQPVRAKNKRENRRDRWWQYGEIAPGLYREIADMKSVLAISLVGSAVMPVRVRTGQVFSHACGVFALDDFGSLAVLSSGAHTVWTVRYTSTMRTDIRYAPSDAFLTLPRPEVTADLHVLGERLDTERRELMLSRSWGLTTTYNHVHDPADLDPAVMNLRDIHSAIDRAVFDAYGWHDLDSTLGHYPTKIGTRWTVSPATRFELLDRLLEENQRRHALE